MNPRGNASTVITVDAACSKLYITELQLWVSNMLPAVADATLEISFGFDLSEGFMVHLRVHFYVCIIYECLPSLPI